MISEKFSTMTKMNTKVRSKVYEALRVIREISNTKIAVERLTIRYITEFIIEMYAYKN
jgi:hypothetical protein